MFHVEKTIPVNSTGIEDQPVLSRGDVWRGLRQKAENPIDFVGAITRCEVLESGENYLLREIILRGEIVREKVTFDPQIRITFERLSGPVLGTILNEIIEDDEGALNLRFSFSLEAADLSPGSEEESAFAETMKESYLSALTSTLATIRTLVKAE